MGNYLKMTDKRRVLALLELGWSYRRIQRETGVRRETIARYDPRRPAKAANLSTGAEVSTDDVSADEGEPKAANLWAGANAAHGPPGLAEPYREQIEAGLRQGLTAQRIWQDLCAEVAYPHSYASVRRYVRRLKQAQPKLVDVMEHPPGEEAQVDFFQGPPTFDEAQGRWRRPWIFRLTLSCSKHGYEEPLWTQERDGFLRAHEHAFVRLGGVPKVIRHDNLKAAVVRACLYDPDVSEVYAAFARHWGFVSLPSRPRHPQEKDVASYCTSSDRFGTSYAPGMAAELPGVFAWRALVRRIEVVATIVGCLSYQQAMASPDLDRRRIYVQAVGQLLQREVATCTEPLVSRSELVGDAHSPNAESGELHATARTHFVGRQHRGNRAVGVIVQQPIDLGDDGGVGLVEHADRERERHAEGARGSTSETDVRGHVVGLE